jgi:hypothetical protein
MGQTVRFQETLRRLAKIDEGFVESYWPTFSASPAPPMP